MTLHDVYFSELVQDETIIHLSGKDWRRSGYWYDDGMSYEIYSHKDAKVSALFWTDNNGVLDLFVTVDEK